MTHDFITMLEGSKTVKACKLRFNPTFKVEVSLQMLHVFVNLGALGAHKSLLIIIWNNTLRFWKRFKTHYHLINIFQCLRYM